MDLHTATQIAEEYVARFTCDEFQIVLLPLKTIERNFGWVFFYGPSDPSLLVGGNPPLIVDRKDGAVHPTGTAFSVELYLESYERVGRTYPFAVAKHLVIIEGWNPGMLKVRLTNLIRDIEGKGLAEAKRCTDEVLGGKRVALTFATAADANAFCIAAQKLGVVSKRETHYQ